MITITDTMTIAILILAIITIPIVTIAIITIMLITISPIPSVPTYTYNLWEASYRFLWTIGVRDLLSLRSNCV
jgi:hypothetical protein